MNLTVNGREHEITSPPLTQSAHWSPTAPPVKMIEFMKLRSWITCVSPENASE